MNMTYGLKKRILSILVVIMVMIGIVSCSETREIDIDKTDNPVTAQGTDNITDNKLIDNNSGVEADVVYKVTYYTVDTKTLKLVQSVSAVKGGASLEPVMVLGLVSDSLEDSSVVISFDDAYYDENGYCVIEFDDSIKDISHKDHNLETLILDACGQSILDNFECNGVIIRIGKDAYVTDQYNFDKEYVYISDRDE